MIWWFGGVVRLLSLIEKFRCNVFSPCLAGESMHLEMGSSIAADMAPKKADIRFTLNAMLPRGRNVKSLPMMT